MKIGFEEEIEIGGERILLKVLNPVFASQIAEYYQHNKSHFKDIAAFDDNSIYNVDFHNEMIWQEFAMMSLDMAIRFYIFLKSDEYYKKIIGDISIFEINRENEQKCSLGFKLDSKHCGFGYMGEAIKIAEKYVFENLELQKIEAYIQKKNTSAVNLIQKNGFEFDGIAKDFLCINDIWLDYNRYIKINKK